MLIPNGSTQQHKAASLGPFLFGGHHAMVLPPKPASAYVRGSHTIPFPCAPAPEQTNAAGQVLS